MKVTRFNHLAVNVEGQDEATLALGATGSVLSARFGFWILEAILSSWVKIRICPASDS